MKQVLDCLNLVHFCIFKILLSMLSYSLSSFVGMQSSLLALALANRFFQDPLVGVPPAISVSHLDYTNLFLSN